MKRIFKLILSIILLITNISFAEIITTNNFKIIEKHIQLADIDTLLVFDVDDVLLQPKDLLLKSKYEHDFKTMYKQIEVQTDKTQSEKLFSFIMLQRQVEPVDQKIVKLINEAQKKGTKVLALTFCSTGALGTITSLEDWRSQELKLLGYNFDQSWNNLSKKTFKQLPTIESNKFVAFQQGIVFTGGASKADALQIFLNYAEIKPKKILFIDDKRKNLEVVETFANKSTIPFIGIEYTLVYDSKLTPLNRQHAKLQLETLEKKHKWLSDQEIEQQINKDKLSKSNI